MGHRSDFEILRDLDRALEKLPEDTDPNDLIEKAKEEEMADAVDKNIRVQVGSRIDTQLWKQVKACAALEGRKAGHVLDDAIRMYLKAQKEQEKEKESVRG